MDLNPIFYSINNIVILIIGWFLGRFLKTRGKIICKLAKLKLNFHKSGGKFGLATCKYKEADGGSYRIKLDFFNEKDVPTALRNVCIIFERKNKKKFRATISPDDIDDEANKVVNLPSRKLVHLSWYGHIGSSFSNDLEIVMKSKKVYFVGYLPNGKKVKKLILKKPLINLLDKRFESLQESIEISQ